LFMAEQLFIFDADRFIILFKIVVIG